jgi:hypothetical protein
MPGVKNRILPTTVGGAAAGTGGVQPYWTATELGVLIEERNALESEPED